MAYKDEVRYYGRMAPFCEAFVQLKQAAGYDYIAMAHVLSRFSKFSLDYESDAMLISKELVDDWVALQPGEKGKTAGNRETAVRQLAKYLHGHGFSVYILPDGHRRHPRSGFTPYIFTHGEIQKIFLALDQMMPVPNNRVLHIQYQLLFRILYGCGLRISEALELRISDVDVGHGILTIRDSKFGKDRLIPMSGSLTQRCGNYMTHTLGNTEPEALFFSNRRGEKKSNVDAHQWFRKVLRQCGIPYRGKGKGPRQHDLRHTFAVHSLQRWAEAGKDIYTMLPLLSTYLGHASIHATQDYLRLTSEIYPDIINTLEQAHGNLIPEMEGFQ